MGSPVGHISSVQPGLNGRLFLGAQDGFDLAQFTNGEPLEAGLLHRWRRTLQRRGREFSERGIPYVFFIVPDAPSVCREDLPPALQAHFRAPGELFLNAMGEIPGVEFVYPLQAMRQARGGLEIFQKKDSHWTTYGSYVAYRHFMDHVSHLVPATTIPPRDVHFTFRRSYGDLGSQMEPEQTEEVPVSVIEGHPLGSVVSHESVGRQTTTLCHAPEAAACRALFFRDSFMTDLAPYIARSFSQVMTIGSTTRVMLDVVESWRAELVVSQVAERKLLFWQTDHQLDTYDTIFPPGFRAGAGARLLQALNMMAQDPGGALSMIAQDMDELARQPDMLYTLALLQEAAGKHAAAHDLAMHALQARPEHASFLGLAARTALAVGEIAKAVELSGLALQVAPYNGYLYELHGYCLVQAQTPDAALRVIELGLARIKDQPNLWHWGAVCLHARGEIDAAIGHAREAVRLAPDSPAYQQLLDLLQIETKPIFVN